MIAKFYNDGWDPADYSRSSSAQKAWADELIGKLGLGGSESILDIGCGDGRITAHLASLVEHGTVLGIDSSPAMIGHARAAFPAGAHPNLSFYLMNAVCLDLDTVFDVAFSNAALHWVRGHSAMLACLRRHMRTGGRLLFQMGGTGNAAEVFAIIEQVMRRGEWAWYFRDFISPYTFCDPTDYRRWLVEAGFTPVRAELLPKDMRHENRAALAGWLRTTWFPFTDVLPGDLRERFLGELLDGYLERVPPDADGATHVRMVRLEVEAVAG